MRRRLHMVPFDVIIPEADCDRYLAGTSRGPRVGPGSLRTFLNSRIESDREDQALAPVATYWLGLKSS